MTTVTPDLNTDSASQSQPFHALVSELAAVTVDSTDLDAWERFNTDILGMGLVRDGDVIKLKMDAYPFRFVIRPSDRDGIASLTWISRDAAVNEIRSRWESAGGTGEPVATLDWNAPQGTDSYAFKDHHGVLHEVFDAAPGGQEPFEPGPDVSGFVTGDAGVGHLVMFDNVDQANVVYVDAFGMTLRENSEKTQVGGRGRFYGCNPRHHTVAAVEVPGKEPGVMHLMVEMLSLDDVGASLDRARANGWETRTALGRHPDHVVSFYIPSPGGFDFEVGCDGLLVAGDDDWAANKHTTRARMWGHDGIRPSSATK